MAHILLRETKPHRDPPRVAWMIVVVLGIALIGALFSADGYRHQMARALQGIGNALDAGQIVGNGGRQAIPRSSNDPACSRVIRASANSLHHFYLPGTANGAAFTFMVDTGSTSIVFPRSAVSVLKLEPLTFDTKTSTAGGEVLNARITLQSLVIENFELRNVDALVNIGGLGEPLLGNTWIKLFRSIDIHDNKMNLCL